MAKLCAVSALVWRMDLDWPELTNPRRLADLSAEERAQYGRFRRAVDARRYMAAHLAMREILGAHLGRRPGALEFVRTWYGKPMLADAPMAFNLSHSGGTALLAITAARTVGVDLETGTPDAADQIAGPAEARRLGEAPGGPRDLRWLWAAKEAVLKASGQGLHLSPQDVAVPVKATDRAALALCRFGSRLRIWRVHALDVGKGAAALALPPDAPRGAPRVFAYP